MGEAFATVEINDRLVDSRGVLREEMSEDGLHLTLAAYRRLGGRVAADLRRAARCARRARSRAAADRQPRCAMSRRAGSRMKRADLLRDVLAEASGSRRRPSVSHGRYPDGIRRLILEGELLAGLDPERRIGRQDSIDPDVLVREVERVVGDDSRGSSSVAGSSVKRSTTCSSALCATAPARLPGSKPTVSTTSVSPSQRPIE